MRTRSASRFATTLLAAAVAIGLTVASPLTAAAAPATPTNLKATAGASSVTLTWKNNHSGAEAALAGSYIEISRHNGVAWSKVGGNRPANVAEYMDHNVMPGQKYRYQVKVYIPGLGWSGESNEASATPGPKVTVSIDGWNPSSAAATKTVNVKSNTSWTVTFTHYTTTDKTWISLSKKSGSGDSSFKITVKANTSTKQRIASIRVEAKNDTAGSTAFTFQVIQAGQPAPKSTSTTTSTPKPSTTTTTSAAPPTSSTIEDDPPTTQTTPIETTTTLEATAMPTDTPTDEPEPPPVGGNDIPWTVLVWAIAAVLIALVIAGVVIFIVRSRRQPGY